MAIRKPNLLDTIDVVAKLDDAVTCDDDKYDEYLETLDEDLLQLDGVPTRFRLKKYLTASQQDKIDDLKTRQEGKKLKVSLGFMAEDVRQSLVSIINPDDMPEADRLELELGKDKKATPEFVATLRDIGVVSNLYNARSSSHKQKKDLKKS